MNFRFYLALGGTVLLSAVSCVPTRGKLENTSPAGPYQSSFKISTRASSKPVSTPATGMLTGPYRFILFVPSISESGGFLEISTQRGGTVIDEQAYALRRMFVSEHEMNCLDSLFRAGVTAVVRPGPDSITLSQGKWFEIETHALAPYAVTRMTFPQAVRFFRLVQGMAEKHPGISRQTKQNVGTLFQQTLYRIDPLYKNPEQH